MSNHFNNRHAQHKAQSVHQQPSSSSISSGPEVAQSLPTYLVQWLTDRGLLRKDSVVGPTSRTTLGLDHGGVANVLQGGGLLQFLQQHAMPFEQQHGGGGGARAKKSALRTKAQLSNTPAAKVHNWTAIFRFIEEDAAAAATHHRQHMSPLPPFSEEDLELWLCGDWDSLTSVLNYLKKELPRMELPPPPAHSHRGGGKQHQQQSPTTNKTTSRTQEVLTSARQFAANPHHQQHHHQRKPNVGPYGGIGGSRRAESVGSNMGSIGGGGIRLNPVDGRRLPHSSDSIHSNPFLEDGRGGGRIPPPVGIPRLTGQQHQQAGVGSNGGGHNDVLQAAQILLQQQTMHQQLASQQMYLQQQQQQQYFAMMQQQQQQMLQWGGLPPPAGGGGMMSGMGVGGGNMPMLMGGVGVGGGAQPMMMQPNNNGMMMPQQLPLDGMPQGQYEDILHTRHMQGNTPNTRPEFGTPLHQQQHQTSSSVASSRDFNSAGGVGLFMPQQQQYSPPKRSEPQQQSPPQRAKDAMVDEEHKEGDDVQEVYRHPNNFGAAGGGAKWATPQLVHQQQAEAPQDEEDHHQQHKLHQPPVSLEEESRRQMGQVAEVAIQEQYAAEEEAYNHSRQQQQQQPGSSLILDDDEIPEPSQHKLEPVTVDEGDVTKVEKEVEQQYSKQKRAYQGGERGTLANRAVEELLFRPQLASAWRTAFNEMLRYNMALRRQSFALWRLWHMRIAHKKKEEQERREEVRRQKEKEKDAEDAAIKEQLMLLHAAQQQQRTDLLSPAAASSPQQPVATQPSASAGDEERNPNFDYDLEEEQQQQQQQEEEHKDDAVIIPTAPNARKNAIKVAQLQLKYINILRLRYWRLWFEWFSFPPEEHVQKKILENKYTAEKMKRRRMLPMALRLKSSNALRLRYYNIWRFIANDRAQKRLASLQHPEPLWLLRRNEFLEGKQKRSKLRDLRRNRLEAALVAEVQEMEKQDKRRQELLELERENNRQKRKEGKDGGLDNSPKQRDKTTRTNGLLEKPPDGSKMEQMYEILQQLRQEEAQADLQARTTRPPPRKCTFCGHLNDAEEIVNKNTVGDDDGKDSAENKKYHPDGQGGYSITPFTDFQQHTWCVMCGEVLEEGDEALYNFTLVSKHNVVDPKVRRTLITMQALLRHKVSAYMIRPLKYRQESELFQQRSAPTSRLVVTIYRLYFSIRFIRRVLGHAPRLQHPQELPEDIESALSDPNSASSVNFEQPMGCKDRCEHLLHYLNKRTVKTDGRMPEREINKYKKWMCAKCGELGVQFVRRRVMRKRIMLGAALRAAHFIARTMPKIRLHRDVLATGVEAGSQQRYHGQGVVRPLGHGVHHILQEKQMCKRCYPILSQFAQNWAHHVLMGTTTAFDPNQRRPKPNRLKFSTDAAERSSSSRRRGRDDGDAGDGDHHGGFGGHNIFEPALPSTTLQRRWNSVLCQSCVRENMSLLTTTGLVHDYCTRVHAVRMKFAFRIYFRHRIRASLRQFAHEKLGYKIAELDELFGNASTSGHLQPHQHQHAPATLTIKAVQDQLHPQRKPHWCYRCNCYITALEDLEQSQARKKKKEQEETINNQQQLGRRHHQNDRYNRHQVDRDVIIQYCYDHLHRKPCNAQYSKSCQELGVEYLILKHVRKKQMLFYHVAVFIAKTLGAVRAKKAEISRQKKMAYTKSYSSSPEPGLEVPFHNICRRCHPIAQHVHQLLKAVDLDFGDNSTISMQGVFTDETGIFGTTYRPPLLCAERVEKDPDTGEERTLHCHKALHTHVGQFVQRRNERVITTKRRERKATAAVLPVRPDDCTEGMFDKCSEMFTTAAERIRATAHSRNDKEIADAKSFPGGDAEFFASQKPTATLEQEDNAAMSAICVKEQKKMCKVCRKSLQEQSKRLAEWLAKDRKMRVLGAEAPPEVEDDESDDDV